MCRSSSHLPNLCWKEAKAPLKHALSVHIVCWQLRPPPANPDPNHLNEGALVSVGLGKAP